MGVARDPGQYPSTAETQLPIQMQIIISWARGSLKCRDARIRTAVAEQGSSRGQLASENRHSYSWINTGSRIASFRLRAAHRGGEDRRLGEWPQSLPMLVVHRSRFRESWANERSVRDTQEGLHVQVQGIFVEDDHMIQTLATNRSYDPLNIRPLLRRSWRANDFLNAKF
jgi:hypothetical protein